MTIQEFIQDFKAKKIVNNKLNEHAVEDYIKETLQVKSYIPLWDKQEIAKAIIDKSIKVVDGYKVVDSSKQFLSFIMAMLIAHTNLEIGDAYADYDALCEAGLLDTIVGTFQRDYSECETVLKMLVSDELQTNTTPAIVAQFLDKIVQKLEDFSDVLSDKFDEVNVSDLLSGLNLNVESTDSIKEFLNK